MRICRNMRRHFRRAWAMIVDVPTLPGYQAFSLNRRRRAASAQQLTAAVGAALKAGPVSIREQLADCRPAPLALLQRRRVGRRMRRRHSRKMRQQPFSHEVPRTPPSDDGALLPPKAILRQNRVSNPHYASSHGCRNVGGGKTRPAPGSSGRRHFSIISSSITSSRIGSRSTPAPSKAPSGDAVALRWKRARVRPPTKQFKRGKIAASAHAVKSFCDRRVLR